MQRVLAIIAVVVIAVATVGCLSRTPKQSGVFTSANSGVNWSAQPNLADKNVKRPKIYPPLEVTAAAVSPTDTGVMYAGTARSLYLTKNGGKEWSLLDDKLPGAVKSIAVQSITTVPGSPDVVYVAGVSGGYGKLFKSTDRGNSFKDIFTVATPKAAATAVATQPGTPETVYVADQKGLVYQSVNGGGSWNQVASTESPVSSLAFAGKNLIVGTVGAGIWRQEGGTTFVKVGLPENESNIWSMTYAFGSIFAGANSGLLLSRDGGVTWSVVKTTLTPGQRVQALAASSSTLYFASSAVVYRTSASLSSFEPTQLELVKNVYSLATSPANPTFVLAGANSSSNSFVDRFGGNGLSGLTQ